MKNRVKIISLAGIIALMSGCAPQYAANNGTGVVGQNTVNNAIMGATTAALLVY